MSSDFAGCQIVHVVEFGGPFGFIKPWTAVRDSLTYSQSFLTPSIVEGLRQKLGVSAILRHRLRHGGLSMQQERTQTADWKRAARHMSRPLSIVTRRVMIEPVLSLAFGTAEDAEEAASQHLCLCRNEDLLLPSGVSELTIDAFDRLPGVELRFEASPASFLVGFNRFACATPMYGHLVIVDEDTAGASSE